jgi:cell cycle checkpoint protein
MSDNLTMHRLLGPEIYTNPGASTIEFNPIAPTFMRKALDLILKKEARDSMRQRIPGPGVLKKFSELGDVRSAISSLQFFCLRGDKDGDWGGRVAAKAKSASRGDTSLTLMEKDSLEIITQRESSLGLFHAVGKVVYNKREDMETPEQQRDYVAPPPHLQHLERPKISLVSIEDLINETGTDIQTFTAALHENYPPSCDGPSFTDTLNACIEHLSDSDLLGSEGRSSLSGNRMGIGMARSQFQGYGTSVDRLRQDEVSFHVAVRGLLFSLPCPVRRKLEGSTGKRSGDTYKMHFPTSQRLWKDIEEMDGLVGVWERQLLDPTTIHSTASRSEGVESWKHNQMNANANDRNAGPDTPPKSMMSRQDILLHQLPYLTKILGNTSTQPRGLDRITQFKGITAPTDDIPDDMLNNDAEPSSVNEWSTDPVLPARRSGRPGFQALKKEEVHVNVQEAVENLLLSDDEIED